MRDPHIHAEKTPVPGFGHVAMRALITEAMGLVPDLPKTAGTGCGVRRPLAMMSTVPERVTCLACREYARAEYLTWAAMTQVAAELAEAEPRAVIAAKATPVDPRAEERAYRQLAARFEVTR
jgi:hypothetical protein